MICPHCKHNMLGKPNCQKRALGFGPIWLICVKCGLTESKPSPTLTERMISWFIRKRAKLICRYEVFRLSRLPISELTDDDFNLLGHHERNRAK